MMVFAETLYRDWGQRHAVERVLFREKTEFQDLGSFENPVWGKVMALDGVIQTTERDNHVYHEMMVHVPVLAHGRAKKLLIIGGGDGGALREAVKHPLDQVVMVEIDPAVIDMSKQHLPELSQGAFDDKRAKVVIADGCKYVRETAERFDVIVVDSTDPMGPGAVLFTREFYADCRRCLTPGGVLVTQNGVPYMQADELKQSVGHFKTLFKDGWAMMAAVPTYVGGFMALGWASDDPALRRLSVAEVKPRFDKVNLKTEYYTPEIHVASFALPRKVAALIA